MINGYYSPAYTIYGYDKKDNNQNKGNNMKFMSKYSESIYALMRMVAGAMFSMHGMQKIFGWFTQNETAFLSQMWFGGMIELICGLLLVIGFQTRIAAFISSGTMAVAYIQFHWAFDFGPNIIPAVNHGDGAILYSFLFLYIASVGAGKWSIDSDDA